VHPILGRAQWLAAYLGAWLVVCVLVAAVFARLGLSWLEGLALLLPLFAVYPAVRHRPLKTGAMIDHLVEQCADPPWRVTPALLGAKAARRTRASSPRATRARS